MKFKGQKLQVSKDKTEKKDGHLAEDTVAPTTDRISIWASLFHIIMTKR